MNKGTSPFAGFEWQLALRYLRARRAERLVSVISTISLIGIALGVATLIIVMSVMNAFRHELTSRILGIDGHIIVEGANGALPDYVAIAARLRTIPGVTRVTPLVEGQVLVSESGQNLPIKVRGIAPSDLAALTAVSERLSPGALGRFGQAQIEPVIVGVRFARSVGLEQGRTVTLLAPDNSADDAVPQVRTFVLAGTFDLGGRVENENVLFMPFDLAQRYFDTGDVATGIEIMLADPNRAAELAPLVQKQVGNARVLTWQVTNSTFFGALNVERNVMALILTLMVLLATMNLISSFVMLVKDKAGDIAILRTMGATQGAVMRVFFIAGASIGFTGTLLGLLIGIFVCVNFQLFQPLLANLFIVPRIDPGELTFVVIVALLLSFLATLFPSWRAARLDPVEALRYE